MKATDALSSMAVGLMVCCALIVTGLVVRRELGSGPAPVAPQDTTPVPVSDWSSIAAGVHRRGASNPKLTIVEIADFECPFCRRYHEDVLQPLLAKFPDDVAIVFRHWPLPYHRFAYPAARAVECASQQGTFGSMHDLLYLKQDSLGLKTFQNFAAEAGVPNESAFVSCMARTDSLDAVKEDIAFVKQIGARGTPTILVNGLYHPVPPPLASLEEMLLNSELK